MSESNPKFRREPAEQRKEALILATLSLVAERGVHGVTVREIAKRAEVTQGLIRHYFSSKEDLVTAAYEHHMSQLTKLTTAAASAAHNSCRARLVSFIAAGLKPPVIDPRSVSLWAGFLNKALADTRMRTIHEQTYRDFRDRLETLIAAALAEAEMSVSAEKLRELAIASNAVLDGLWMEGGALPAAFQTGELPGIGLRSVGAIIGLKLAESEEGPS